jgi:hypothetical protein
MKILTGYAHPSQGQIGRDCPSVPYLFTEGHALEQALQGRIKTIEVVSGP